MLNVSSAAALECFTGLMAYGMAKVALEHLTRSAAAQLDKDGVAVNCLRIDLPVASRGFVANTPGSILQLASQRDARRDRPVDVARGPDYTARVESLAD